MKSRARDARNLFIRERRDCALRLSRSVAAYCFRRVPRKNEEQYNVARLPTVLRLERFRLKFRAHKRYSLFQYARRILAVFTAVRGQITRSPVVPFVQRTVVDCRENYFERRFTYNSERRSSNTCKITSCFLLEA